jgi:hypothetical protein
MGFLAQVQVANNYIAPAFTASLQVSDSESNAMLIGRLAANIVTAVAGYEEIVAGGGIIGGGGLASCLGTACIGAIATTVAGAAVIADGAMRSVSGAVGAGQIASMLYMRATSNPQSSGNSPAPIHGNSVNSPRTTYLYELVDENGNHLKYGITSNPDTRYTHAFMADKRMLILGEGSRRDMYVLENRLITTNPRGPLQLNNH